MRYFILVGFILFIPTNNLSASHIIVAGFASGTWNVDTVYVAGDVTVPDGTSLAISPGTLVLFQGHFFLMIKGRLLAQGIQSDSIRFSVSDTTGFSNLFTAAGSWNGILFHQNNMQNDSSLFEYCVFEFGKAVGSDSTFWYGGAVCIRESSKIRFSDCRFANNRALKNGGALYIRKASIAVNHCRFETNHCGLDTLFGYGGALCMEYSGSRVYRNTFIQNSSTGVGGGLSLEYSDPRIESNRLSANYSAIGGGVACLRSAGIQSVVNNLVTGNSGYFFGGGVAFIESSTLFANNTIADNNAGAGGGLFINFNSFPVIYNSIVWGNISAGGAGNQVYIWDTYSAPEFYYCIIGGGVEGIGGTGGGAGFIGVFENCFDEDPLFVGFEPEPYYPDIYSVSLNNGSPDTTGLFLPVDDLTGSPRIFAGVVDIGPYEQFYMSDNSTGLDLVAVDINVFPNPFSKEANIRFWLSNESRVVMDVYDPSGRLIDNLLNSDFKAGEHLAQWRPAANQIKSKSTGIYYLKVTIGNAASTVKLLLGE